MGIMLSEVRQTENDEHGMMSVIYKFIKKERKTKEKRKGQTHRNSEQENGCQGLEGEGTGKGWSKLYTYSDKMTMV